MLRLTIVLAGLYLGTAQAGETAYITDKVYIALRAEAAKDAAAVKTLVSGAVVEVVQRAEAFSQVRDADGVEGWVDNRYLVTEPPAIAQIPKIQTELTQAQAALAQELAKASQTPVAPPVAAPPAANDAPVYLLVALSFAMLILGFFAGMWWLRERYRRRLGGMYLRI